MSKKPYTAPTVTDLGNAVKQTKGVSGVCWESYGNQYGPPLYPPGGGFPVHRPEKDTEKA